MTVSAAPAGTVIVRVGMSTMAVGTLLFIAAAVLGFAVAVVATAAAFRMVMFLMIMLFMVSHSVPLRAVNEVHWADSTPWSQLQSQAAG
ncbi:hypothetical protein D3C78_1550780 [compost metagenome]